MITTDKQLVSVHIKNEKVKVQWSNELTYLDDEHEEGEDGNKSKSLFSVTSAQRPHKDLTDGLKSLRKHGLALWNIDVNSKQIGSWGISGFKISGDVTNRTSRVVLFLTIKNEKTKKVGELKCPETVMYPEKDETLRYHDAEKMSPIIEKVIEEVWLYLNGKSQDEEQLPLFPHEPKLQTNFTS